MGVCMAMLLTRYNNGLHPTANQRVSHARLGRIGVSPRRVMPGVRRPAFLRCGGEWLDVGGRVAG